MKKNGFTLIELMLVMVIIGILLGVWSFNFRGSQSRGRDAKRKADLKNVAVALEAYYSDHDAYPLSNPNGQIICRIGISETCLWGEEFSDQNSTLYMAKLPKDPLGYRIYFYYSTGPSFQLYARLDNTDDGDVPKNSGTGAPQGYSSTVCGSALMCNYGISSTNITPATGRSLVDDEVAVE